MLQIDRLGAPGASAKVFNLLNVTQLSRQAQLYERSYEREHCPKRNALSVRGSVC